MRWLVLLLVPALAGCLAIFDEAPDREVVPVALDYDPSDVEVVGIDRVAYTVSSFDDTELAAIAYVPRTTTAHPNGGPAPFPAIVFMHGIADSKNFFEGSGALSPAFEAPPEFPAGRNLLLEWAREGFITIAYDARGYGQSGGESTVAGPAEVRDLQVVLEDIAIRFHHNGHTGVLGHSYGAGQTLQALSHPGITAAVSFYAWADLYDGLLPGNVPKSGWVGAMGAIGTASTAGRTSPLLAEWAPKIATRDDLQTVEAQMDIRDTVPALAGVDKPLLLCQGLQESLFPHVDRIAAASEGFTRTYVYTGGHAVLDAGCLERALDWFHFFLLGYDTKVDAWPVLEAVVAAADRHIAYPDWPATSQDTFYLRAPDLADAASEQTFTVAQRIASSPFTPPAGLLDGLPEPQPEVPASFMQDPQATFFTGAYADEAKVIVGRPSLLLGQEGNTTGPFQVVATLYHQIGEERPAWRLLARGAAAPHNTTADVLIEFPFVHAELEPGDALVLKVAANDSTTFAPYPGDYEVVFTGKSRLVVPFFG